MSIENIIWGCKPSLESTDCECCGEKCSGYEKLKIQTMTYLENNFQCNRSFCQEALKESVEYTDKQDLSQFELCKLCIEEFHHGLNNIVCCNICKNKSSKKCDNCGVPWDVRYYDLEELKSDRLILQFNFVIYQNQYYEIDETKATDKGVVCLSKGQEQFTLNGDKYLITDRETDSGCYYHVLFESEI